jgi:hypothetical protein
MPVTRMKARFASVPLLVAVVGSLSSPAQTLYFDRTSFMTDSRVSGTTTVNFDSQAVGTDLTGQTLSGATFTPNSASPLLVISGATGVRFPMSPSSGLNLLSPGGSNTSLEDDGLIITFGIPTQAAGLDVVFDVPDGASFVGVSFFDASNTLIASNSFIPAPSGAPGYQFVGLVADTAIIKRIVFTEFDPTAPDDHVGYDTLTFMAIPEPSAVALLLLGAVGVAVFHWRRRGP